VAAARLLGKPRLPKGISDYAWVAARLILRPIAESGVMASAAIDLDHKPRRAKARLRTGIPAALVTLNGRQDITLVDLSETGAGIVVADPGHIAGGMLQWMDYEVYGAVVRRVGEDVGLQFDTPIDPAWVLDTRAWLPKLTDEKGRLRRFARDWVQGTAPPARISEMLAPKYGSGNPPYSAAKAWLRTAVPFALAGALLGVMAGLLSIAI
jgi:hypothetical protein